MPEYLTTGSEDYEYYCYGHGLPDAQLLNIATAKMHMSRKFTRAEAVEDIIVKRDHYRISLNGHGTEEAMPSSVQCERVHDASPPLLIAPQSSSRTT